MTGQASEEGRKAYEENHCDEKKHERTFRLDPDEKVGREEHENIKPKKISEDSDRRENVKTGKLLYRKVGDARIRGRTIQQFRIHREDPIWVSKTGKETLKTTKAGRQPIRGNWLRPPDWMGEQVRNVKKKKKGN